MLFILYHTILVFVLKYLFVYFRIISVNICMKPLLEIIAENVRFYRNKTGLSQLKLSSQVEISPSYLNDIEHGRQYVSVKMIERLASFFEIEPYQLLLPLSLDEDKKISIQYENDLRILKHEIDELFDAKLSNK